MSTITAEAKFGIVVAKNVMVPMRDGVRLAIDLYFPAVDGTPVGGKLPTILGRTSYDKNTQQTWVGPVAEFFTPRGYVVAIQDLRGRHASEGTGEYFHVANVNEGRDGYDTIEWIADQAWSNGKVGMVGSSHGGIVQSAAAIYRPPHLAALWPDVSPTNIYQGTCRHGGTMALHMFGAQFLHGHDAQELRNDPVGQARLMRGMEELSSWVYRTPFKPGHTPIAAVPNLERVLFDYYYRGAYDEFWAQDCMDFERHYDRHADVPAVYSSGWYDPFARDDSEYFAAMSRQNSTPQRLILGPWNHMTMRGGGSTSVGEVEFGPDAQWGDAVYNQHRLRWFDRWLKEIPNGVENDPPVRIFVMGGGDGHRTAAGKLYHGGRWRDENEWPLARARFTPFYLRHGGALASTPGVADAPPARYTFDPHHPVPTLGGAVTGFYELVPVPEGMNTAYLPPRARMRSIVEDGPMDQRERPGVIGCRPPYRALATRPDVLVFQTPPLDTDVEVTGPITVQLWVSSSAPDTDFTAKLIDVYPPNADFPDGFSLNLCDSILRTRYRESWEREVMMRTGEVYPITITLPPISNLFMAGHRIRLDISSSNFPRFDINPNTGEPVGRHTWMRPAHNVVYLDAGHPSHVVLPVIPTA